jgi:hypothetical protein
MNHDDQMPYIINEFLATALEYIEQLYNVFDVLIAANEDLSTRFVRLAVTTHTTLCCVCRRIRYHVAVKSPPPHAST